LFGAKIGVDSAETPRVSPGPAKIEAENNKPDKRKRFFMNVIMSFTKNTNVVSYKSPFYSGVLAQIRTIFLNLIALALGIIKPKLD